MPLATAVTSARKVAAVTSCQTPSSRRRRTTASGASRALRTTSSVRLPVRGTSTVSGAANSRTAAGYRRVRRRPATWAVVRRRVRSACPAARVRASREGSQVAEQTSSSIVVDAGPAEVMEVIGDFEAYPEWAKGVKRAEVRAESAGWADQVYFVLDV